MILAYMLGDYESAEEDSGVCRVAENNLFGTSDRVTFVLYDGWLSGTVVSKEESSYRKKNRARLQIAKHSIKTFKNWAKPSSENFLKAVFPLEAELATSMGEYDRVHSNHISDIYNFAITQRRVHSATRSCERTS